MDTSVERLTPPVVPKKQRSHGLSLRVQILDCPLGTKHTYAFVLILKPKMARESDLLEARLSGRY